MAQSKAGQTSKKNSKNKAQAKASSNGGERKPHPMKGKTRGKIATYKDVFMAFMIGGVEAVQNLEGAVSADTLWTAYDNLEPTGRDRSALKNYILETHGERQVSGTGRGRGAPQVGESRNYKIQALPQKDDTGAVTGEGEPFIRLPLSTLGLPKGAVVRAEFEDGQIVIAPAEEGTEGEGESEGA